MKIKISREPKIVAIGKNSTILANDDIIGELSDEDIVRIGIRFTELMGMSLANGQSLEQYALARGYNVNDLS